MYYCITAVRGDEGQSEGIYRDHSGFSDKGGTEDFDRGKLRKAAGRAEGSVSVKKQKGSIENLLTAGICILAMTVVMVSYMDCVRLIRQKEEVGQLARKYILKMETTGYLTDWDCAELLQELSDAGVTETDLSGTTMQEALYGESIALCIRGKLEGEQAFEEKRVSTSKN